MRELMAPPIPFPNSDRIKSEILLQSAQLFALRGYHSVSVRDIAAAVKLSPEAIYQYFPSKLSIIESMMLSSEEDILSFYSMLDRLSDEAESFSQIINNIFIESKEVANPYAYYAIHCAMTNQFLLECCRHLYYDIYFKEGHIVMQRQLHTAIQRGLVKPFDVVEVATTITNCFVSMISMNVGYINGFYNDFDPSAWYQRQIEHIFKNHRSYKRGLKVP